MKKLFIETLQQDARNIFYVADFLFRSNSRLCFFYGIFYLRLIFQFSRQICMLKSYNDKKTYLTLIFLHQGWLPLSKVINITLYSWFCCLYCQRKVNILSIFRKSKKIVTEPYLRLALYLEKKKKEIYQKTFPCKSIMVLAFYSMEVSKRLQITISPFKVGLLKFVSLKNAYFSGFLA